jgi:hypothetical protein
MQTPLTCVGGQKLTGLLGGFQDGADPLPRMREIEKTDGVGQMNIQQSLHAFGSIHNTSHPTGLQQVATVHFPWTRARKRGCVGHT